MVIFKLLKVPLCRRKRAQSVSTWWPVKDTYPDDVSAAYDACPKIKAPAWNRSFALGVKA